jgi:5-methyltetrahydropteroyltriglutamate--homocysteine methyltransferase
MPTSRADLKYLRADQIGGLAAPLFLTELFERHGRSEVGDEELFTAQDSAIGAAIRRQEEIGFPVISDGEFRRRNFQESFALAVTGFDVPEAAKYDMQHGRISDAPMVRAEQDFAAPGPAIFTRRPTVERLRFVRNVPLEEYRFASRVAVAPVKVTLLSPDRISQRFDYEASRGVYKDMDEFLADVVAIERQMIAGLIYAGCRYIQIDAPGYTAYVDPVSLDRMRARGEDPDANLARSIAADNAVIEGFGGVTFGLHVCRGNPRTIDPATGKVVAQWHREGPYDAIAERLFSGLNHDRLLLEYDSERAGDFAPLRFVPRDKVAVLGLVTTKDPDLEPLDVLRRRIDEAARHLPLENLALSPQCGFGGPNRNVMAEADQWRKFERILETVRAVWG